MVEKGKRMRINSREALIKDPINYTYKNLQQGIAMVPSLNALSKEVLKKGVTRTLLQASLYWSVLKKMPKKTQDKLLRTLEAHHDGSLSEENAIKDVYDTIKKQKIDTFPNKVLLARGFVGCAAELMLFKQTESEYLREKLKHATTTERKRAQRLK